MDAPNTAGQTEKQSCIVIQVRISSPLASLAHQLSTFCHGPSLNFHKQKDPLELKRDTQGWNVETKVILSVSVLDDSKRWCSMTKLQKCQKVRRLGLSRGLHTCSFVPEIKVSYPIIISHVLKPMFLTDELGRKRSISTGRALYWCLWVLLSSDHAHPFSL